MSDHDMKAAKSTDTMPAKKRKLSGHCFRISAALLLLSILTFFVAIETNIGTRLSLKLVETLSVGKLRFSGVNGRLADHIEIDEIAYRDADHSLIVSGAILDWQPWALLSNELRISSLEVSALSIASRPSASPIQLPPHLKLPVNIQLKHFAAGRVKIAEIDAKQQEAKPIQLNSIIGKLDSDGASHKMKLGVSSSWGSLQFDATLATHQPFATTAHFTYLGQDIPELPLLALQGEVTGSLQSLLIRAKASADGKQLAATSSQKTATTGDLQLQLAPFETQALRHLTAQLQHLNPHQLSIAAPHADLNLQIDLRPENAGEAANKIKVAVAGKPVQKNPSLGSDSAQTALGDLSGQINIQNLGAAPLDKHGLPFRTYSSRVLWHNQQLQISEMKLGMPSGGISGKATVQFRSGRLPIINARLIAQELNLLQIDSRTRSTQIAGELQLQTSNDRRIDFQTQLRDPHTSLNVQANFMLNAMGDSGLLRLEKFELVSDTSRFSGSGDINFEGKQAFKVLGKLSQFNPAHWVALPSGRMDADVNLTGTIAPKLNLQVRIEQLSGEWSGQKIAGGLKAQWQTDGFLSVDQADLEWGKNKLSALGSLGRDDSELAFDLQAADLAQLAGLIETPLSGTANVKGKLGGRFTALSADVSVQAEKLMLPRGLRIAQLRGSVLLEPGQRGALDIKLTAGEIQTARVELNVATSAANGVSGSDKPVENTKERRKTWAEQASFVVKGNRDQHQFELNVLFDKVHRLLLTGSGNLDLSAPDNRSWKGQWKQLSVSGFSKATSAILPNGSRQNDLQLLDAIPVEIGPSRVSVGAAKLVGPLANINLAQFEWTPNSIQMKGRIDDLLALEVFNLIRPQEVLSGNLKLGLSWDLQFKDKLQGSVNVQKQSGDLLVPDADGSGQPMALGVQELNLQIVAGGLLAGSDAERVKAQLKASGTRLGEWRANLETQLRKLDEKWTFTSETPIKGDISATIPELQWLAAQFNSEFGLKGAVSVDAKIAGKFSKPSYQVQIEGRKLELALASEGLLFPNGELSATLDEENFQLRRLHFSNQINFVPKIEQLRDLNWTGQIGEFNASGAVNWRKQSGSIDAIWQRFPLLQRKDRWLVMSGQASITQADRAWALIGKLNADAAYFKLPKLPPPSLSNDVIIVNTIKLDPDDLELEADKKSLKTKLDLSIDMGPRFVFTGRGLNTALTGTLRLKSNDGNSVQASGSIVTNGGQYEGYGQQLEIERGILKFQGAANNPSLNIRALRKGLSVEAGVDVTGTVANPEVRLVSEPNVPDNEKIAWLVLGREADQVGANDASLLLSAAGAIFGTDASRNSPREIFQDLGFDEFSIGPPENAGASKLPNQTIAGQSNSSVVSSDKVVTIGKRLRPGLVLSVERGVSDASSALKLSWQLGRRVRLIARSGTDNSVDVKYSFSFN